MPDTTSPEVLVVGAGPVGLTAALELARRGVRIRLIDRAPEPAVTSRALAVHARTLELLDQLGIAERAIAIGQRVVHFTIHQRGKVLCRFDTNYDALPTPFPFSVMIDQVITERLLRERLAEFGVVPEWGVGLESLTQTDGAVAARLLGPTGVEDVVVPWLVGTDGGRSTVRKQLGLTLIGNATETWLNLDAELDADLPPDSNHLIQVGRSGSLLLVPFPQRGKWRIVDTVDTDHADDMEIVRARIERKLRSALKQPVVVSKPTWSTAFTVQQRLIPTMRQGRVFVAGDAAHVHSPASGQGMNTGIQDAVNLGWKLANVVQGHADDGLLDTYSAERVPIGETLLGSTGKATALVALRNVAAPVLMPLGLGALRRITPLKRKIEGKIIRGFCGLGLAYVASPLSLDEIVLPGTPEREYSGPAPGTRIARCAERASAPGWVALRVELADPRWTLLVNPQSDSPRDWRGLVRIAERYGAAVSVRAVVPADARTRLRPVDGAVVPLGDSGELRDDLDLAPGRFVLVRPDGYVATVGAAADVGAALGRLRLYAADESAARAA